MELIKELFEEEHSHYDPEIEDPWSGHLVDLPKETRVIRVNTAPLDEIFLIKTENGYRIAAARVRSY